MMNKIYQYRTFQSAIDLYTDALSNISGVSIEDPTQDW